jgi:hypothetical protein
VQIPWPLNAVIHKDSQTTLVIADAGLALRMLGDQEVPLDSYIAHSYLAPLLPKQMSNNEAIVLHYFDDTRITSEADVHAAAVISALATPWADNLAIRAARDQCQRSDPRRLHLHRIKDLDPLGRAARRSYELSDRRKRPTRLALPRQSSSAGG